MSLAGLFLTLCLPLSAHVISMSTADFRIDGRRGVYELRMPIYEVQHVIRPETRLLEAIRFSSRGVEAKLVRGECREDARDASYRCTATYEWPEPVEELAVACSFPSITVPNHVHLIRAYREDKTDQAVLDFSQPNANIRFRPPTPFELFAAGWGAGFARAFSSGAAVLFLVCLALAARTRSELALLSAMFLAGEVLAALIVPRTAWSPHPRFVEAALALTIGYLAVEILTLPKAGQRWAVALVLGGFHGLSYALYVSGTGADPLSVLSGMAVANALAVAAFALLFHRLGKWFPDLAQPAGRAAAGLLLAIGLGWFFWRLRG